MVGAIIESTFVLIMAFLILGNASSFSSAAAAIGNVYIGAVKTLQGR